MSRILEVKDLNVDFRTDLGQSSALDNISLEVHKGEVVAIVGESGSGKSVTALSILQLIPTPPAIYRSGEIIVSVNNNAVNVLGAGSGTMQKIRGNEVSMIFQEPMTSLNPVMTCGKQVMEAMRTHRRITTNQAREKTLQLFEKVKLPDPQRMFGSYPHQLSGGQKQRVMIAMAMSCEPALLICDEPTTALDVTVQKNILQLVKELQLQTHMGVIFITHDLGVVAEIADRVVVMYKGKIVEQNHARQLLSNPQHAYTRALLACRPALHHKGERLPVVSDFMPGTGIQNKNQRESNSEAPKEHSKAAPIPVLLSVESLSVHFPSGRNFLGKTTRYTKAVNNVSFDVYQGETLGLVGESGCGKTTLGRAILHLIKPTSGRVIYRGRDIIKIRKHKLKSLRKEMQIIFQDPYAALNPRKTVGSAIAEPLMVHNMAAKEQVKNTVLGLLEKVGLGAEHYDRYPHEFSGGQRQRIVIARALALQPAFIVCDESVSALDVSVQAQVLNLLNDLKKEFNLTLIFISHDLSVVQYFCDRIIVMNRGEIEEIGPAEQVYGQPRSDYTKKLLESIPGFQALPNPHHRAH